MKNPHFLSRWLSSRECGAEFSALSRQNDGGLQVASAGLEAVRTATSMTTRTRRPVTDDRKLMSGLGRKSTAATITASRRTCALMVAPILLPESGTTMRLGGR